MPTITEGLQEIKTLSARIAKKRSNLMNYVFLQNSFKDPMESKGGMKAFVENELRSIADLERNIVGLREGIAKANQWHEINVCGETKTIFNWLTWRREIAVPRKRFLEDMYKQIQDVRESAKQKGVVVAAGAEEAGAKDVVLNVSEPELYAEIEKIEEVLSSLDGQLSLKNATIEL